MNGWHVEAIPLEHPAEREPLRILKAAAVATRGLGDGRLFPLLVVDTSSRPDVDVMITAHRQVRMGDVATRWAKLKEQPNSIFLILESLRPSRCTFLLRFPLDEHAGFVDQIVQTEGLYLQRCVDGVVIVAEQEADRILMEVPSEEFRSEWDRMFARSIEREIRKRGVPRRRVPALRDEFIREWRTTLGLRLRSLP